MPNSNWILDFADIQFQNIYCKVVGKSNKTAELVIKQFLSRSQRLFLISRRGKCNTRTHMQTHTHFRDAHKDFKVKDGIVLMIIVNVNCVVPGDSWSVPWMPNNTVVLTQVSQNRIVGKGLPIQ